MTPYADDLDTYQADPVFQEEFGAWLDAVASCMDRYAYRPAQDMEGGLYGP